MKKGKNENYKYLLRLCAIVDEYLADDSPNQDNLPDIVVDFCIVAEKIIKIRLHDKNPVLIFENGPIKDSDRLVAIIKKKEIDVETIKIDNAIGRYGLMFDDGFSESEAMALADIYKARNHFIHDYKSDDFILQNSENIIKKMGTLWEKISAQAIRIFGKELIKANKPQKKYSETELEQVLTEEVKKKIESKKLNPYDCYGITGSVLNEESLFSCFDGEKCPRCGAYGFTIERPKISNDLIFLSRMSDPPFLYKCKKCQLELTSKEYEIAKKIKAGVDTCF
jgi:hypothetical protein